MPRFLFSSISARVALAISAPSLGRELLFGGGFFDLCGQPDQLPLDGELFELRQIGFGIGKGVGGDDLHHRLFVKTVLFFQPDPQKLLVNGHVV